MLVAGTIVVVPAWSSTVTVLFGGMKVDVGSHEVPVVTVSVTDPPGNAGLLAEMSPWFGPITLPPGVIPISEMPTTTPPAASATRTRRRIRSIRLLQTKALVRGVEKLPGPTADSDDVLVVITRLT